MKGIGTHPYFFFLLGFMHSILVASHFCSDTRVLLNDSNILGQPEEESLKSWSYLKNIF